MWFAKCYICKITEIRHLKQHRLYKERYIKPFRDQFIFLNSTSPVLEAKLCQFCAKFGVVGIV